jgi:hypothetical protein
MKQYLRTIMLSCKKATFLTEKNLHSSLTIYEKLQLNLHLRMCNACKNYAIQSKFIHQSLNTELPGTLSALPDSVQLPQEVKFSIIEKIKNNFNSLSGTML